MVRVAVVEALGAAFLTFLVTEAETVAGLEMLCLVVGDMVRNNFKKRKMIVGINKGKEQEKKGVRGE